MKKFFADTNFYLRFLLQDNQVQAAQAEEHLHRAEEGREKIVFLSAIILEMSFVLRSNYDVSPSEISKYLSALVSLPYLEIEDRDIWIKILPEFVQRKIGLIDIFLFEKAKINNAKVLTFDKKLSNLK